MPSMDYVKYENTYKALKQCSDAIFEDEELSESEQGYRDKLIKLCKMIADNFDEDEDGE